MSDNRVDPSGNTEAFRAFTQNTPPPESRPSKVLPLIIAGVAAVALLIAVIVWFA